MEFLGRLIHQIDEWAERPEIHELTAQGESGLEVGKRTTLHFPEQARMVERELTPRGARVGILDPDFFRGIWRATSGYERRRAARHRGLQRV